MIPVLLQDDDFLVVEKPGGIPTQPLKDPSQVTVASQLSKQFPEIKSVGGFDWGAVHRLDIETSGLVIFARNQKTYDHFRKLFSSNKIEKEYLALVHENILKPGKITWPIGPDPKSAKRVKVYQDKREAIRNKAQEAMTFYTPLSQKDQKTLLKIKIKTGRRHQIRAHLAFIGHPIVGDKIYGNKKTGERTSPLRLHAHRLIFLHPVSGKKLEIVSKQSL